MNANNQMYRMFKIMKQGYAEGDVNAVEQGARCWLDLAPENPFPEDTPAYEAFFQMQKCYSIWRRGDIDRKINRRRMIMWANKLCESNPKQPYKFDKKAEEEEQRLAKEAEEQRLAKLQEDLTVKEEVKKSLEKEAKEAEKQYVFGVIPEKKTPWYKQFFKRKKEGAPDDSERPD